jgi:hypothetical protein
MFERHYSSPHTRCLLNGSICAVAFSLACIFLIWSAPTVFGASQIQEYPTHEQISQQLTQLDVRMALSEKYQTEMYSAEIRKRLTIAEQNLATVGRDQAILVKAQWVLVTGVFLPYLGKAMNFYSRAGRRKRRRQRAVNKAENDAEDEAKLEEEE